MIHDPTGAGTGKKIDCMKNIAKTNPYLPPARFNVFVFHIGCCDWVRL